MPSLYVVHETSAGYGLFKATDRKLMKHDDVLRKLADSVELLTENIQLKKFEKFQNPVDALEAAAAITKGEVPQTLTHLLSSIKDPAKINIAIADARLATGIRALPGFEGTKFHASSTSDTKTEDLFRAIRSHLDSLMPETKDSFEKIALGLSHSTYQHKLKFDRSMADVVMIHAIKMLEDIDKELNVYAMRTREWYGWHFPEMGKLLNDNIAYAGVIIAAGKRDNYHNVDLTEILPEEVAEAVKSAAEISMGTDLTDGDMENVKLLALQVVQYHEYRGQLATFIENRMKSIAPNLTALVGWLVGAKLIAHTGSLKTICSAPASTIQILGAEKALFRALKTKHNTPKYGIIYNSSLVGQASQKMKGKIARMLAAKSALAARIDGEPFLNNTKAADEEDEETQDQDTERDLYGVVWRTSLENRLRKLDGKALLPKGVAVAPDGTIRGPGKFSLQDSVAYNEGMDGVVNSSLNGAPVAKRPLIEEVLNPEAKENGVNGASDKMEVDTEESSEEEEDDDDELVQKAKRKAEKAAKKAEKEARKAEKAAKKAAKKAKKEVKEEEAPAKAEKPEKKDKKDKKAIKEEKKRKREEVPEEVEEGNTKKKHKKKKTKET